MIGTIDPHAVIDDPAVMMTTLGALTVVGCELTHRAVFRSGLP